jgi:hypothetical protein
MNQTFENELINADAEANRIERELIFLKDKIRLLTEQKAVADRYIAGLRMRLKVNETRPGTLIDQIRDLLLKSQRPMHIDVIMASLGMEEKQKKLALIGTLSSYARRRRIFSRPAPNTFFLIELEGKHDMS